MKTVKDLIKELQKLPEGTNLGHYDYYKNYENPPEKVDGYPQLYYRVIDGEPWLYTEYDNVFAASEGIGIFDE